MIKKKKILFSARDPGGSGQVIALLNVFRADERFEVYLAASGAALKMLKRAGEYPLELKGEVDIVQKGQYPTGLLESAKDLLHDVQPDAVIVSLSSFGTGIDEALLATARVPTFALQDFWGDVNLGLGVPAGTYFVIDDYAVEISEKRWGVSAVPVGSPKHFQYAALDIPKMRIEARKKLGIKEEDDRVIGFFGQTPDIPGHETAFEDLLRAIEKLVPQTHFILREHPKFKKKNEKSIYC